MARDIGPDMLRNLDVQLERGNIDQATYEARKAEVLELIRTGRAVDRTLWERVRPFVILAAVAVVILVLPSLWSRPTQPTTPPPSVSKYTQTWAKDYGDTTCREWLTGMSEQQRWAGAADMLSSARSKDGGKSLPADDLISAFMRSVSDTCGVVPTESVAAIGGTEYLINRDIWRP